MLRSMHWPLVGDSTVLHYGNFLISQGKTPYLDFIEPDLPGAYIQESLAMHVFGGGDFGWRFYEILLLGLVCLAASLIARSVNWQAGLAAGLSFVLLRMSDGPWNAGQREEVMTAYVLLAIAALFQAIRVPNNWLLCFAGFAMGMAGSIKPTVYLLGAFSLLMLVIALRHCRAGVFSPCLFSVVGFLAATSLSVLFLWRYHAFHSFMENVRSDIPYYATVGKTPVRQLIAGIPRPVRAELLLGLLLAGLQRKLSWVDAWERIVLLGAIGFGLISYLVQAKPFDHHLYAFYAFVFLFTSIETWRALSHRSAVRVLGALAAAYGVAIALLYASRVPTGAGSGEVASSIASDLTRLGGQRLNGKVQCFDLVIGCTSALYQTRIVESFTLLNDFTVLPSPGVSPLPQNRQRLWRELQNNPPAVIVVTNQQLAHGAGFDKIDHWPEFSRLLASAYVLDSTKYFGVYGYRVYIHR